MNLNDWAKEIHANAVAHGWWRDERQFPEIIALCHSELSEALEEYRDGMPPLYYKCRETLYEDDPMDRIADCSDADCGPCEDCDERIEKQEGVAVELADTIIRILDYAWYMGWDMEDIIRRKHEYNKTRPWRHNNKVV